MKKKFNILNNVLNNEEFKVSEISNDEKDEIKKRVLSKINRKKKPNRKKALALVAGITIIVGVSLNSKTVQAAISKIGKGIGSFWGVESIGVNTYGKEILKEVESNGIKFVINEAIVDDDTFTVAATIDYTDFDNESIGIRKNKNISIVPGDMNNFSLSQNGIYVNGNSEGGKCEFNEKEKVTHVLYEKQIENPEEVGDYNIDIKLDEMKIHTQWGKDKFVEGNWDIDFSVNSDKLKEKVKVVDISKEIEVGDEKVILDNIRISPVSIRFNYREEIEDIMEKDIQFKFEDQDGNEIKFESNGGNSEDGLSYKYVYEKEIESIKIIPGISGKRGKKVKYYEEKCEIVNLK